jgi:hypothetical protein
LCGGWPARSRGRPAHHRRLHVTYLERPRHRRGVAKPGSVIDSFRVGEEGLVPGARLEPNQVDLGWRIRAAHSSLDRSAVPIQQGQHRVLVPLTGDFVLRRHLDDGDQQQVFRWVLIRRCHRRQYFTDG